MVCISKCQDTKTLDADILTVFGGNSHIDQQL